MPSTEENMNLLWLILSQLSADGPLKGIDWAVVAQGLGLEQAKAARLRWSRLRKELLENGVPTASASNGTTEATKKSTTPKKAKAPVDKTAKGGKAKRVSKKRKMDERDDEEDEDEEAAVKEEEDDDDDDDEIIAGGKADDEEV